MFSECTIQSEKKDVLRKQKLCLLVDALSLAIGSLHIPPLWWSPEPQSLTLPYFLQASCSQPSLPSARCVGWIGGGGPTSRIRDDVAFRLAGTCHRASGGPERWTRLPRRDQAGGRREEGPRTRPGWALLSHMGICCAMSLRGWGGVQPCPPSPCLTHSGSGPGSPPWGGSLLRRGPSLGLRPLRPGTQWLLADAS